MTSFALRIEPAPAPRLAAGFLLLHVALVAAPWIARCPALLALALSSLAVAGFWLNLRRVPGGPGRLRAFELDGERCRAQLATVVDWLPAEVGSGTRAAADWVLLDVRVAGGRAGWLLTRGTVPSAEFRRLKARVRLSC